MADYMMDILGDMLYVTPADESKDYLPSPEDLIHKVLVKVRSNTHTHIYIHILYLYVCMHVCICMYVCTFCMYIRM